MIDLTGKHALIFGVASEESIAWAIAKRLHAAGAKISLGYQQRFKSRILQLVKKGDIPVHSYERCDVTNEEELSAFYEKLEAPVDILIHSIAFAHPGTFAKPIRDVSLEEFGATLAASAYSLLPVVRSTLPFMTDGGSVITLSYLGGHRVVANYKLMGIAKAALEGAVRELAADVGPSNVRVNAISAGPVRTIAASQIAGFDDMLKVYESVAPIRRSITQDDVADLSLFLSSDLSKNITGQTLFVDAGYSILAMAELPKG
ncbi:MAG: SDR family oxidoreductase [Myxococcota bacterium]